MASAHEPGEVAWVEVPGGRLAVEMIRSGTEPVLAIHGISSQRKLWNWLRAAAPDLGLIAPDLRGRGDSVGVTLPSSIGRHAADMVLVLNNLGLEAVHVCGMSKFFTRTAPLLDPDDPLLLDYLAHDLFGPLVRLDADALMADAADIFFGSSKWRQLQVPVRLLTAEWSTGADSAPAYPADAVQSFRDALDVLVTVRPVPGVDHAASIMTMTGARATADLIAEALAPETLA